MVKKHGWIVLLTVGLTLAFAFCLYVQRGSAPEPPVAEVRATDGLAFCVFSASGEAEDILCWEQDEERCYVFLPSYADLSRTEVHLLSDQNYQLEGMQLTQGLSCVGFALDTDYQLTGDGLSPKILQFVQSANVATMYIDTLSGNMEQVHADKSNKEYAAISVYTADGQVDYRGDFVDQIRGRGNSSWLYNHKKPYNIYLYHPASLLKMDRATEWALIANANDDSNLRNKLIYDFANNTSTHIGWAPTSEYIDLYLNGEYAGLYLLCEKVENIAEKLKEKEENILININDHVAKLDDRNTALRIEESLYAEIAVPSMPSENEYARLEAYLLEFANALTTENWIEYIDLDSFARKYLIEEIFANVDGGEASQYYYWDQSTNRLFAGPCWDYDLTLGDMTWVDWISPYCLMMQGKLWYRELWTHEEFQEYVQKLYCSEYLPLLNELIDSIPVLSKKLEKATNANQLRWKKFYKNRQDSTSLQLFLSDRVTFLNSLWKDHAAYCKISFEAQEYTIVPMFVPINGSGRLIPTPKETGLEEDLIWYREDNGEPFDYDSIITGDLTLYVKTESVPEEPTQTVSQRVPVSKKKGRIVISFSVLFFFMLFIGFLRLDHRRNRQGRGRGHA